MSHSMHNHGPGIQSVHTGTGDQHYTITNLHQTDRSPIHVIPYSRNEEVVHRQDLVTALNRLLPPTSNYCSAALYGLGGSGKTQLALQFAYDRGNDREHSVFWVHSDSKATFTHDYKEIAEKLGIGSGIDGEELLKAVRNAIDARSPWVLVLDNADDLALFGVGQSDQEESRSLLRYIPKAPGGVVLWTSRDARITGTLVGAQRAIEVRSMTAGEAQKLLISVKSKGNDEDKGLRDALVKELQYFPLAISQAGAYIQETRMTVEDYLDLLKRGQDRWNVLKESQFDRHRRPDVPNSVLETWEVSIDRIEQENKTAYRILHTIAYLDSQNLPLELIAAICRDSTTTAMGQVDDLREVKKATAYLMRFSFLNEYQTRQSRPSYEVHKLVHEATRYRLKIPGREGRTRGSNGEAQYASIAIGAMNDIFPDSARDTWDVCERYLIHAIRVGEWAEVCGKQIEVATLLTQVSTFLHDRRRWREQERICLRVLDLQKEALGEKHPDTVSTIRQLATAYGHQGRPSEGERLFKQALDLDREVFGEKHPSTINDMRLLASAYQSLDRYSEAEYLMKQALDLGRDILGEKHPVTIDSVTGLATIHSLQGQYREAEHLYRQALELRRVVDGEEGPDTLHNMVLLAITFYEQGQYREAEHLFHKVLDLQRKVLGEEHPDALDSMGFLAFAWFWQGRNSEAEHLMKQALELQRKVLGEENPDTLKSMRSLGVIQFIQGQDSEAEQLMKQALELQRKVLGEEHPETIRGLRLLADVQGYSQISIQNKPRHRSFKEMVKRLFR